MAGGRKRSRRRPEGPTTMQTWMACKTTRPNMNVLIAAWTCIGEGFLTARSRARMRITHHKEESVKLVTKGSSIHVQVKRIMTIWEKSAARMKQPPHERRRRWLSVA